MHPLNCAPYPMDGGRDRSVPYKSDKHLPKRDLDMGSKESLHGRRMIWGLIGWQSRRTYAPPDGGTIEGGPP
jgi:hypothetical protein